MMKEKMKKCTAILLVTMMMGMLFMPVNALASGNVKVITKTYTPSKTGYYTFTFSYDKNNYKNFKNADGENDVYFFVDGCVENSYGKYKKTGSKITTTQTSYLQAGKKYTIYIYAINKKYNLKITKMATSGTYNGIKYSYNKKNATLTLSGKGKIKSSDYDNERSKYYDYYPWKVFRDIKTVVINKGITEIGASAFESEEELKKVSLPSTIKTLSTRCFAFCYNLSSISNLKKVTFFDNTCLRNTAWEEKNTDSKGFVIYNKWLLSFVGTENSQSNKVTIPSTVKKISPYALDASRFGEIGSTVVIPNSVNYIGEGAFYLNETLKNVKIGSGVTYIGAKAFYSCKSLTKITIPKNVKTIGAKAFGYGYNLEKEKAYKVSSLKITGKKNSAAYKYAKANSFKFTAK